MTKSLKQIYDTLAIGTSAEPLATTTTSIVTAIDFSKGNFQESSAFGNFFSEIFHLFASTPSGSRAMNWVQRKIYLYNVTFGLFMLDWWERCLFNILVIVLMWFIFYNGSRYVTDFCKRKGKALPVQVMAGVVILTKETAVEQQPYKALSASATKAAGI
ncbi:hypothetical protein NC651_000087 [Populus alba x Populus x berolinensis]|nr:hypothetical protein NC651_000087 [Populus alba x Populus x berolinensis]